MRKNMVIAAFAALGLAACAGSTDLPRGAQHPIANRVLVAGAGSVDAMNAVDEPP